jgi:hypothetical protein
MKHLYLHQRLSLRFAEEARLLRFAAEGGNVDQPSENENNDTEIVEKFSAVIGRVKDWWKNLPEDDRGEIKEKVANALTVFSKVIHLYGPGVMVEQVLGPAEIPDNTTDDETETVVEDTKPPEQVIEDTQDALARLRPLVRPEPLSPEVDPAVVNRFREQRDTTVDRLSGINTTSYNELFGDIGRQLMGNCYVMVAFNGLMSTLGPGTMERLIRASVEVTGDTIDIYLPLGQGRNGSPIRVPRSQLRTPENSVFTNDRGQSVFFSESSEGWRALEYAIGVSLLGNPPNPSLGQILGRLNQGGDSADTLQRLIGAETNANDRFGSASEALGNNNVFKREATARLQRIGSNQNRAVTTLHTADLPGNDAEISLQNAGSRPPNTFEILEQHVVAVTGRRGNNILIRDSNQPQTTMEVTISDAVDNFNYITQSRVDNLAMYQA